MTHKNPRLMHAVVRNAQRNALGGFLENLPDKLNRVLSDAETVWHPELSWALAPVVSKASRLHEGHSNEVGARVHQTTNWQSAWLQFIDWSRKLPTGDYVLVIGGGNGEPFDGVGAWISDLPGFRVPVPQILDVLVETYGSCRCELLLAAQEGDHATVLESCGGRLDLVYETSAWGLR